MPDPHGSSALAGPQYMPGRTIRALGQDRIHLMAQQLDNQRPRSSAGSTALKFHRENALVRDGVDAANSSPDLEVLWLWFDRMPNPEAASLGVQPPDHRSITEEEHGLTSPRIESNCAQSSSGELVVELAGKVAYKHGIPSDRHARS